MGDFGLPEFAQMAEMPLAGITFDKTFFVQDGEQSQPLYFHETVDGGLGGARTGDGIDTPGTLRIAVGHRLSGVPERGDSVA